jgi:hypothetical protein
MIISCDFYGIIILSEGTDGETMPEITRFFGIIIRMFTETGIQHHEPHIHAYYQEFMAIFSIISGEILAGSLPRRQQRLVEAWIEIYKEELFENWECAKMGNPINKISPLRKEEK